MAKKEATKVESVKGGGTVRKMLIWGLAAMTLGAGSAAAVLYLTGGLDALRAGADKAGIASSAAREGADAASPAQGPAQYVTLDPPFVVNFEDQGMLRYLQVSVSAMARDPLIVEAVASNMPYIRNNLILLFGSQSFDSLASTEGKEKLRAQALEQIQSILRKEIGKPGVEAVFFTNFVMQ